MKRFLPLFVIVGLIAVGCQKDTLNDSTSVVGDSTTLTVAINETRTSLGGKAGTSYPVYWSEGDRLVVNGILSEDVQICANNRSCATFEVKEGLNHPYLITYPYCESTTAEKPIVKFAAEQTYAEGTFASGNAPMCGYNTSENELVVLSHLASVLRIPIKAAFEGVVLDKIVITSQNKIAGEFEVDCQSATISATASCGDIVTYSLPANYTLSTSEVSDLFITLPAVDVGVCTIEFVCSSGEKMVANWAPSKPLSKGVVREFKTITFKMGVVGALDALTSEEDVLEIPLQKYAKSNELKIMSFNVRTKTDGDTDTKNWEYRKDACVALIKDQMTTIIGFQEADYTNQWKYLNDQLTKEYDGYGVNRDTGKESGSGETMGILYNKSVVQKLDGGTFWLSETPNTPSKGFGANYARNATWGLFKHIPTGITFYYINTHLDHQVAEAQIEGMKLISQHFEDYKGTYPLFLTGDMNIRSDNVALDVIEDYMYNAREVAPQLFTDYNTTYNGYATNRSSIIDHIYCSDYLRVEEYHTINEDYGVPFVSDHYPIYAIVKLE